MDNGNYPWLSSNPNWEALRDDLRYRRILNDLKDRWQQLNDPAS